MYLILIYIRRAFSSIRRFCLTNKIDIKTCERIDEYNDYLAQELGNSVEDVNFKILPLSLRADFIGINSQKALIEMLPCFMDPKEYSVVFLMFLF